MDQGHPVNREEVSDAVSRMDQGDPVDVDRLYPQVEGEDEVSAAANLRLGV
jgi:hypothetical protein